MSILKNLLSIRPWRPLTKARATEVQAEHDREIDRLKQERDKARQEITELTTIIKVVEGIKMGIHPTRTLDDISDSSGCLRSYRVAIDRGTVYEIELTFP